MVVGGCFHFGLRVPRLENPLEKSTAMLSKSCHAGTRGQRVDRPSEEDERRTGKTPVYETPFAKELCLFLTNVAAYTHKDVDIYPASDARRGLYRHRYCLVDHGEVPPTSAMYRLPYAAVPSTLDPSSSTQLPFLWYLRRNF